MLMASLICQSGDNAQVRTWNKQMAAWPVSFIYVFLYFFIYFFNLCWTPIMPTDNTNKTRVLIVQSTDDHNNSACEIDPPLPFTIAVLIVVNRLQIVHCDNFSLRSRPLITSCVKLACTLYSAEHSQDFDTGREDGTPRCQHFVIKKPTKSKVISLI